MTCQEVFSILPALIRKFYALFCGTVASFADRFAKNAMFSFDFKINLQ